MDGVTLYESYGGNVIFNLWDMSSHKLAGILDENDINSTVMPIEIEEKVDMSEIKSIGYGFERYDRAVLRLFDEHCAFREIDEIIYDVIEKEQPIHFEELCRRVAPIYDRQKVTSMVRDEVASIFSHQLRGMITKDKNGFVRIKNFTDVKVRIPHPNDDYIRPIAYICNEELSLAMKAIAKKSFGITPDDLFIVTAREFGFKRTGENILHSLRKVYQQMHKNGEVTEVDGKVHIVS